MRAKHLTLLVAVFAIMAMMFVSCNSEVAENSVNSEMGKELVYATFANGAKDITVGLNVGYEVPAYDSLFWYYWAEKNDTYGQSGETGNYYKKVPGDTTTGKGLDGKVGPFSQGAWNFKLVAYSVAQSETSTGSGLYDLVDGNAYKPENLVFAGELSAFVLRKDQQNYIPISVTPAGSTGKIEFKDAYFYWENYANEGPSTEHADVYLSVGIGNWTWTKQMSYVAPTGNTTGEAGYYKLDGTVSIPSCDSTTEDIPVGVYSGTVKVVDVLTDSTIDAYTSYDIQIKVYGGLTSYISGNLLEGLSYENYFLVPEQQIASVMTSNTGAATFTVDNTPSEAEGKRTTVVFEAGALDANTQHTIQVQTTNIETASTKFTVESTTNDQAVAAIGLTVLKTVVTTDSTGAVISTETEEVFTDKTNTKTATITTTIATGLPTESLKLWWKNNDGDDEEITITSYNSTTGELVFSTTHFSDYYVTSPVEARNTSNGKYYVFLSDALNEVNDGQTIQVIKNVSLSSLNTVNFGSKDVTLNLNGNTISGYKLTSSGKLRLIGNGTIENSFDSAVFMSEGTLVLGGVNLNSSAGDCVWFNNQSSTSKTVRIVVSDGSTNTITATASGADAIFIYNKIEFVLEGEENGTGVLNLSGNAGLHCVTYEDGIVRKCVIHSIVDPSKNAAYGSIVLDGVSLTGSTFSSDVSEKCSDGYCTTLSGNVYVISEIPQVSSEDAVAAVIFEETTKYYGSLANAFSCAPENATVKVLKSNEFNTAISIKRNVTLDLNGENITTFTNHTVNGTIQAAFGVYNGATFTITDSSEGETGKLHSVYGIVKLFSDNAQFIFEKGNLEHEDGEVADIYGIGYNNTLIWLKGGTITSTGTSNSVIHGGISSDTENNRIIVDNCTMNCGVVIPFFIGGGDNLVINKGASITTSKDTQYSGAVIHAYSDYGPVSITINGGTLTSNKGCIISLEKANGNAATATINGGTFSAKNGIFDCEGGAVATVTGGTFNKNPEFTVNPVSHKIMANNDQTSFVVIAKDAEAPEGYTKPCWTLAAGLAPTPTEEVLVNNNSKVSVLEPYISSTNKGFVITVDPSQLTESASSDPNQGTHKWLALEIKTGLSDIRAIRYNGTNLTDQDVTDASVTGCSDGSFVLYVKAENINNNKYINTELASFTLNTDGYDSITIKIYGHK